ncbi:hypothetical protein Tco_0471205, partial [Tanacetum coccineum]
YAFSDSLLLTPLCCDDIHDVTPRVSALAGCDNCGGSPHPGFDCQTRNTPNYDQGPCYNQDFGYNQPPFYSSSQPQQFDCCEFCGGPHYSSDCQAENTPIYDQGPCYNQNFSDDQPSFYSSYQQQQFDCCEVCGGPHYSSDCQTRNQLVYEPSPSNNYDFPCFDQPPQYHIDQSPPRDLDFYNRFKLLQMEIDYRFEEMLRPLKPNSPAGEPEGSDDYTEVTYDKKQCLSGHYTAPVTPPPLAYTPTPPVLATMEPLDTFLMGDESELTLDSDLEYDMPATTPLPTTNVREENLDINLPLEEHLDSFSTGDREIDFDPIRDIEELKCLLADDLVPVPRVFDEPLGNSDSVPRSYDPGPPESTPVIDESSLLVTPLPDPKQICLREVERFDPFFSLTQSGGTTWVMERPSYRFPHMPSPRPAAYSPTEVMYCYYHPHLTSGDGFDHGPKMK